MSKKKIFRIVYIVISTLLMIFFLLYAFVQQIETERQKRVNIELNERYTEMIEKYDQEIQTMKDSINILRNTK